MFEFYFSVQWEDLKGFKKEEKGERRRKRKEKRKEVRKSEERGNMVLVCPSCLCANRSKNASWRTAEDIR